MFLTYMNFRIVSITSKMLDLPWESVQVYSVTIGLQIQIQISQVAVFQIGSQLE